MRSFLLSATAVFSLFALPVVAGDEPGTQTAAQQPQAQQQEPTMSCLKWPVAMIAAQANNPDAQLLRVMEGGLAHDFVSIVNQLPPVSTFDGDHVALFFRKSDANFLVVIGEDECAKHVVELPAAIFARMVGQEV